MTLKLINLKKSFFLYSVVSIFRLSITYMKATVVYLGHAKFFFWKKLGRAHDILSRTHDLLSRAHDIISRAHDLIIILVHFTRHLHQCKQDQQ